MGVRDATTERERRDLVTHQVMDESRLIRFVAAPDGTVAPDLARKACETAGRAALSAELRAVCDAANPQSLQRSMLITSAIYGIGGVFFLITCRTLQKDWVAR